MRDCAKFDRMAAFVAALPALRRRLKRDFALAGLLREKVLACVVKLLSTSAVATQTRCPARLAEFGLHTLPIGMLTDPAPLVSVRSETFAASKSARSDREREMQGSAGGECDQ